MPVKKEILTIEKIINEVLRKGVRKEALFIMSMAEEKDIKDFFLYYKKKQFNVVCMVVDAAKYHLVQNGKLTHSPDDIFGSPFLETTTKQWEE
jgi:hypothetical protein